MVRSGSNQFSVSGSEPTFYLTSGAERPRCASSASTKSNNNISGSSGGDTSTNKNPN